MVAAKDPSLLVKDYPEWPRSVPRRTRVSKTRSRIAGIA